MMMDVAQVNALEAAIFTSLGVWPCLFALILLQDSIRKVPVWPFVASSFVLGGFVLFLYLGLRQWGKPLRPLSSKLTALLESRVFTILLWLVSLWLIIYALLHGSWSQFLLSFQEIQFVHVMTLDFILIAIAFPFLIYDDMTRRGGISKHKLIIGCIPLIGSCIYLILRKRVKINEEN